MASLFPFKLFFRESQCREFTTQIYQPPSSKLQLLRKTAIRDSYAKSQSACISPIAFDLLRKQTYRLDIALSIFSGKRINLICFPFFRTRRKLDIREAATKDLRDIEPGMTESSQPSVDILKLRDNASEHLCSTITHIRETKVMISPCEDAGIEPELSDRVWRAVDAAQDRVEEALAQLALINDAADFNHSTDSCDCVECL